VAAVRGMVAVLQKLQKKKEKYWKKKRNEEEQWESQFRDS
jgi:hypothetical protein